MTNRSLVLIALFAVLTLPCLAQQPPSKNAVVAKIVSEVSAKNIRSTIEKLVSFGTRHTLSDTVSETRGIGAARRWIKSEFERYAKSSGGRMTVDFFETLVPPSRRIPSPTNVVDVVATLRPNPAGPSASRIIVVSGHYDSRATNGLDATSDAPGADDDGSGTAVVLE